MSVRARELLTVYHPFFAEVKDDTVVCVVVRATAVMHKCLKGSAKTMTLHKPADVAFPAAYCSICNTLYVGGEK